MRERTLAELEISFKGPAVDGGHMNVRDLAPSMLGLGVLFESANRILNGRRASVNVNVKATSSNSFHILYEVAQMEGAGIAFQELLSTAVNMKELLFGGPGIVVAVFALIKWLRGRTPKLDKVNENLLRLTIDNQTYDVPLELLKLYQDIPIRRALADMVRPVKENGIDRFEVHEHRCLIQSVTKEDVEVFDIPEFQESLLDQISRKAFSIVSLAFKEDNKWRLTDGQATYSVFLKDAAFQNRVDNNDVAFAKGDVLICDLRTIQWQIPDGVKTEYEVTKVHEHKQARQLHMFNLFDNLDQQ